MSSIFPLEIPKPVDIVLQKGTRGNTTFIADCTSKHFLSDQQKSSYLSLVYLESLLWSIFFHFEVDMIGIE